MEHLVLVRPDSLHKARYEEMMDEWERYGGRINPGALRRVSGTNGETAPFERWLAWVKEDVCADGRSPQHLFFLEDKTGRLLGAISIRPELDDEMFLTGGHMGYGIRPSERRKGLATRMLALAIPLARTYGITRLLLTCDKDNTASARTIQKNGGVLENEVPDEDGTLVQRYWIDL